MILFQAFGLLRQRRAMWWSRTRGDTDGKKGPASVRNVALMVPGIEIKGVASKTYSIFEEGNCPQGGATRCSCGRRIYNANVHFTNGSLRGTWPEQKHPTGTGKYGGEAIYETESLTEKSVLSHSSMPKQSNAL